MGNAYDYVGFDLAGYDGVSVYSVLVRDIGLPTGKDFLVELVAPLFPKRPSFGTANKV